MNIDPRQLTVTQWADAMTLQLTGFSQPPRLDSPDWWQGWALVVNQSPRIAAFNPPNPYAFSDWREWAMRFNQAVDLTT
jgi:hypothetical protein